MADFGGSSFGSHFGDSFEYTGRAAAAHKNPRPFLDGSTGVVIDNPPAISASPQFSLVDQDTAFTPPPPPQNDFGGKAEDGTTSGLDWFEHFHVLPRALSLGNVLATLNIPFEVYSAFRRDRRQWLTFVNNAGPGTTLQNVPVLPFTFNAQSNGNLGLVLQVLPTGKPFVDDDLVFGFDPPSTINVHIMFQRIVLFPSLPEMPYTEELEWLTDVLSHKDGTEQRIALRKNPRQLLTWDFVLEDGPERARMHNLFFDWQARMFGVPVWHDLTRTTSPVSVGATVVNVEDTSFGAFRSGEIAVIYKDDQVFDVLPIASLTATSITFGSQTLNSYPSGTLVAPVVTASVDGQPSGSRFPTADARFRVKFRVETNDQDIASTAAFSSFLGKVLLDDPMLMSGSLSELFDQEVTVIDNGVGVPFVSSSWSRHKRGTLKSFFAGSRQRRWQVRQLLHALRGRQVSFYIPTFSEDLTPLGNITSGLQTLDIVNVGYARFVRQRQPNNVIRVIFLNSATSPIVRTIINSSTVDSTKETITVDSPWTSTHSPSDVRRIEYLQKVRLDSDTVRVEHRKGDKDSVFSAPIKAVFE